MGLLKTTRQGGVYVVRDENDIVVKKQRIGGPKLKVRGWRALMRQFDESGEGIDELLLLKKIAHGKPFRRELPDGSHSEWMVPDLPTQLKALLAYIEFDKGKAVAQTEALKAEQASDELEQYRNIPESELYAAIMRDKEAAKWLTRKGQGDKVLELENEQPEETSEEGEG